MTVFISGKITGYNDYWYCFYCAEIKLNQQGDIVLNPADTIARINGLSHSDYLHICFAMIDICDTVAFLPNWTDSEGSQSEMKYVEEWNKNHEVKKNILFMEG